MIRVGYTGLLAAALLVSGGCSDGVGPNEIVANGLRIEIDVAPSSVERQETLVATLRLENLQDEPVEMTSSCTSLALIKTFRGDERVDLEGNVLGCWDALTAFHIGARETLVQDYEIRAVRFDEEPVAKGTYALRVEFMVPDLPDLETSFTVK